MKTSVVDLIQTACTWCNLHRRNMQKPHIFCTRSTRTVSRCAHVDNQDLCTLATIVHQSTDANMYMHRQISCFAQCCWKCTTSMLQIIHPNAENITDLTNNSALKVLGLLGPDIHKHVFKTFWNKVSGHVAKVLVWHPYYDSSQLMYAWSCENLINVALLHSITCKSAVDICLSKLLWNKSTPWWQHSKRREC